MTVVPGGRPLPIRSFAPEDDIIYAEQLVCVQEQLAALRAQRQHVIGVLRDVAQRPRVGLTTAERAGVAQEVSAALAMREAIAEAWDYWWSAYCDLQREPPPSEP
jgi:hypothetical protein